MKNDMELIMEGWRGYLLEEQAMHELHQELLTEDFASVLQKLKDVPGAIKRSLKGIKKDILDDISDAFLKAAGKAQEFEGSLDDFIEEYIPAPVRKLAKPALGAMALVGMKMGLDSAKTAYKELTSGGTISVVGVVGDFITHDLASVIENIGDFISDPEKGAAVLQMVGIGENVKRP